jgi:FHS family Na+ dependent glucose MFS transporter 1
LKPDSNSGFGLIAGYFLSFLVLGVTTASLGPALPYLAQNVGTSLKGISSLFIGHRTGYLIGSLAGGHLYDRIPGNRLMGGVLLVLAAGMCLTPVTALLGLLVLVVFVVGMVEGTVDVGGNVLLVWMKPPRLGSLMNALHLFFGLGGFVSPLVLIQAVRITGQIRWGYWLLAAGILPVAVSLLRFPGPKPVPHSEGGPDRSRRLLLPSLLALFFFFHVAAESAFGGWIYTYSFSKQLVDRVTAGYLTSAFWAAFTFGRLAAILLALRLKAKIHLGGSVLGASLSAALLVLWPESPAVLWIATLCFGLTLAALFPGTMTLASENMHMSGRLTGVFLVGSSLGSMSLPWLIGQFFESAGPGVFPVLLLAALGCACLLFAVIALLLSLPPAGDGDREVRPG